MISKLWDKSKWTILCILGLALHHLIEEHIRPCYQGIDAVQFLLGVAPNFLASFLIFPFAGMAIWKMQTHKNISVQDKWFWVSLIISSLGLMIWEFMQLTGNLVFDYWDILFTVLGSILALILYKFVKYK